MYTGLKAKGYAKGIELYDFINNQPRHATNPAKGFVGSPFEVDPLRLFRTTIYPAKLTEYGSKYGHVENMEGASIGEIRAELLAGNPVVAYETLYWKNPIYKWFDIEGEQQYLLDNNHAVLVCGYDMVNNKYFISDPWNRHDTLNDYQYWIDGYTFEKIYNERRHAVVIK